MLPALSARASFVAKVVIARRFETRCPTRQRPRPGSGRCRKSPAPVAPISATGPARTRALCLRGEVIVSAITPQHQPHSLCLAAPRNLPLAMAASLFENG